MKSSSLPFVSIKVPTFTTTVPSSKESITLRTYLVKEEKMFLMAQESKDMNAAFDTLKQVLTNCSHGLLDVNKLAVFDVEYLFLQLRAESVGAECKMAFRCQQTVDEKKCDTLVPFTINLKEVNVLFPEGHTDKIQLEDNLWVKMRYPGLGEAAYQLSKNNTVTDTVMSVIASCVDAIYTKTEMADRTQLSESDVVDFLEQLRPVHFREIQNFFITMPRLSHTLPFKCPTCGYEQPIVLEGMESFLA